MVFVHPFISFDQFTYFFSHSLIIVIFLQTTHKMLCHALRLPIPPVSANSSGEEVGSGLEAGDPCSTVSKKLNKLLLAGCDQSGTSTLFKQVQYGWNISLKRKTFLYVSLGSPLIASLTKSVWFIHRNHLYKLVTYIVMLDRK